MRRPHRRFAIATAALILAPAVLGAVTGSPVQASTGAPPVRVSVTADGSQPNGQSWDPQLSADGRYVTFNSYATNLGPAVTSGVYNVYVRDTVANTTKALAVAADGTAGNRLSEFATISADGRYIAFSSESTNLPPTPTSWVHNSQVYLYDQTTGELTRVSSPTNGREASRESLQPMISADGRFITYSSHASNLVPGDTNNKQDIFLYDIATKTNTRISPNQANGASFWPTISPDGRYIGYMSYATNLVPGDTNANSDLFVYDREAGTTTRINVTSAGRQSSGVGLAIASFSADGRLITYHDSSPNLVPGDTNQENDAFLYDQNTRTTTRISTGPGGVQADGQSLVPRITGDGSQVVYWSNATNLVPGDTNGTYDTFLYDTRNRTTRIVSQAADGAQGNAQSASASITPDGKLIALDTDASNFAPDDTNGLSDIYLLQS
jgi:dipeptidyl aminopeptidase/acylaminoacyl peptidase